MSRLLAAFSAATLCTAVLVGCGGGTDTSGSPCDVPGVTAAEVKAGLLYPDTGAGSDVLAPARAGVEARFALANAAGGVNGRRIAYDWRDDQSVQATNLVMSRQLVEESKVYGILDLSAVAAGGAPYLAARGIPVVGFEAGPVWSQYRNMFAFNHSDGGVDTFGRYAQERGGRRAMVVSSRVAPQYTNDAALQRKRSFESVGIPVTMASIDEPPSDDQINEITRQMLADHIDVLAGSLSTENLAKIVVAVRSAGVPLKLALTGAEAVTNELLREYGARLAGLTSAASHVPPQVQTPATIAYRAAMATYAPELRDPNQTLAIVGYVVADMFLRGLQAAGSCPTQQSFITGLRAVNNYTAGGLISAVDFERDFGRVAECYAFVAVNNAGNGLDVVNPNYCGQRLPI